VDLVSAVQFESGRDELARLLAAGADRWALEDKHRLVRPVSFKMINAELIWQCSWTTQWHAG